MSVEPEFRLILTERVENFIDESGEERPLDPDQDEATSSAIVRSLEAALGQAGRTSARRTPRSVGGHSFGGHDVLQSVYETVFVIGSSGVAKAAFGALRTWLELRKARSVTIEVSNGSNKRKVILKATDFDDLPSTLQKLVVEEQKPPEEAARKKPPAVKDAKVKAAQPGKKRLAAK